jgi:two-component system chemotaxis response regulator CheB
MMPELDGLGVLKSLAVDLSAPRVVLVSSTALDSAIAVEALQLGAVALVQKPTAMATDRLYELEQELVRQVRIAASSVLSRGAPRPVRQTLDSRRSPSDTSVIVIGTSTGGPHALTRLLPSLPRDLRVPVAAVVHIPVGYTATLAERLDRASELTVLEAQDGLEVRPGMAVIARAGLHLRLQRVAPNVARCSLSLEPLGFIHRPSVDVLFSSAAEAFGRGVLGVVLTGMGNDGLEGARAIRKQGGAVLTEHASSCVVDGMPRAVLEAGLSDGEATLTEMTASLLARL